MVWIGLLGSVVPTLAAAIFALRAYAELEVLADQSRAMAQTLRAVEARLATAMLADRANCAQLFRMKGIEAG